MMQRRAHLAVCLLALWGCEGEVGSAGIERDSGDSIADASQEPEQDAPVSEDGSIAQDAPAAQDTPLPEEDVPLGELGEIVVPEAPGGAMSINPLIFPDPVTVGAYVDEAGAVEFVFDGETVQGLRDADSGRWEAQIHPATVPEGSHPLGITARGGDGQEKTIGVEILVVTQGIEFTNFASAGSATTPRLHTIGDQLWVTWIQPSDSPRRLRAQRLDGAGRRLLDRDVLLTPADQDVVSARAAAAPNGDIGILYQRTDGSPYKNMLTVVKIETGEVVVEPIELDEPGDSTTADGDIAFDTQGFVAVYRNYDVEGSELRWVRVNPADASVQGPITAAASGDDSPVGSFTQPSFIRVAATPKHAMITFTRNHYDPVLDLMIPRAQAAVVGSDATQLHEGILPQPLELPFGFEAHVHIIRGELVPLWTLISLTDEEINPPHRIFGARVADLVGSAPQGYEAVKIVEAPLLRGEMTLVEHPAAFATMGWSDERQKDGGNDRISVYCASLDHDLSVKTETYISHSRLISSFSELSGAGLGHNTMMAWLDQRKGGSIISPKSEVYFETLWY